MPTSPSPARLSLEDLFQEAKRAKRYALPMPAAPARRASPDDTRFYLSRAPSEARPERFPLRVVPAGGLHFPAPAREHHREDGAFWSCPWTTEGVVEALRGGAFFTSGHHDFAGRATGSLALAPGKAELRAAIKRADSLTEALALARDGLPRPSALDPDELLTQLLTDPQGEAS